MKRPSGGPSVNKVFDRVAATSLEMGEVRYFEDVADLSMLEEDNYRPADLKYIDDLYVSIKEVGVTVPIQITIERSESDPPRITIKDGHQRKRAVERLRLEAEEGEEWLYRRLPAWVEVTVKGKDQKRKALGSVVVNAVKKKENLIERAYGMRRLKSEGGYSNERLASILGVSRKTVERTLGVLDLPEQYLQQLVAKCDELKDSDVYNALARFRSDGVFLLGAATAKRSKNNRSIEALKTNLTMILAEAEAEGLPRKWRDLIFEKIDQIDALK